MHNYLKGNMTKKTFFLLLTATFLIPQLGFSQVMFRQPRGNSVYDSIPSGYRVFPLPVELDQLKGIQEQQRIDVYATYSKKGKISAFLAEMKTAQKGDTPGSIPLIFKTDGDEDVKTILLLQNVEILYVPQPSQSASDYKGTNMETRTNNTPGVADKNEQFSFTKTATVRLLLTPEESMLAAHAISTSAKLVLVLRNTIDTEIKVLEPINTLEAALSTKKEIKTKTPIKQ